MSWLGVARCFSPRWGLMILAARAEAPRYPRASSGSLSLPHSQQRPEPRKRRLVKAQRPLYLHVALDRVGDAFGQPVIAPAHRPQRPKGGSAHGYGHIAAVQHPRLHFGLEHLFQARAPQAKVRRAERTVVAVEFRVLP